MTIEEAITLVDDLKPNQYSDADKLQWLSDLDGQIINELYKKHEMSEDEQTKVDEWERYSDKDDTELMAPSPYEYVYIYYLMSQIDFHNAEIDKYNTTVTMYNNAYATLSDYWTRTHLPSHEINYIKL